MSKDEKGLLEIEVEQYGYICDEWAAILRRDIALMKLEKQMYDSWKAAGIDATKTELQALESSRARTKWISEVLERYEGKREAALLRLEESKNGGS